MTLDENAERIATAARRKEHERVVVPIGKRARRFTERNDLGGAARAHGIKNPGRGSLLKPGTKRGFFSASPAFFEDFGGALADLPATRQATRTC